MTESNFLLWTYIFKPALILIGAYLGLDVILYILGWRPAPSRDEQYKTLESDIAMRRHERTQVKIGVLDMMCAYPENEREELWNLYHELDAKDQEFTRQERDQLVEASGFTITEREQYELDHGINPYK